MHACLECKDCTRQEAVKVKLLTKHSLSWTVYHWLVLYYVLLWVDEAKLQLR